MKKIIEGLIGVMLFTGSVVFANNNVPAKHNVHPKTPACTHCTKTSCALGSIHCLEPVHQTPGNKKVLLIFIAFILNSCSSVENITVINDLSFQITNLCADRFPKM